MELTSLLCVSVGLFALVRFGFIPRVEQKIPNDGSRLHPKTSAQLALLSYLNGAFLVATLSIGAVVLLVLLLNLLGGTTPSQVKNAIALAQASRNILGTIKQVWGVIGFVVVTVALGLFAFRHGWVNTIDKQKRTSNPSTFFERVQTFFISRGLVYSIGKGGKALYFMSLALLIPASISIASAPALNSVDNQLVRLNDLHVRTVITEIEEDWNDAQSELVDQETDISKDDEEILDELAHEFERLLYNLAVFRPDTAEDRFVARSVITASNIASEARSSTKNKGAALINETSERPAPMTEIGRHTKDRLTQIARSRESFLNQARNFLQSFQRVSSHDDLVSALTGQVISEIASYGTGEVNVSIDWILRAKTDKFTTDLVRGKSIDEALQDVATLDPDRPFATELQLDRISNTFSNPNLLDTIRVERVRHLYPSFRTRAESHVDVVGTIRTATGAVTRHGDGSFADVLGRYEDWFPSSVRAANRTPRIHLLSTLAANGIIRATTEELLNNVSMSAMRSFDFDRLRGFSRVGGVLIGRAPRDESAGLEVSDISWEDTEDGRLVISLHQGDGDVYKSIPHKKALVWHALLYVVDGRPVAVTMSKAEPIRLLKILVHPTLEDTALGYRFVELDRFVDRYTSRLQWRIDAERIVDGHQDVYNFAWAHRVLLLTADDFPFYEAEIEQLQNEIKDVMPIFRRRAEIALLDDSITYLGDGQYSPLSEKSHHYDQDLVAAIIRESSALGTADKFAAEIAREFRDELSRMKVSYSSFERDIFEKYDEKTRSARGKQVDDEEAVLQIISEIVNTVGEPEPLRSWLVPPPSFQIWSGVREKEYDLVMEDIFIGYDRTVPDVLRFVLNLSFTSDAELVGVDDSTDPWNFRGIETMINDTVIESVSANYVDSYILDEVSEFTVLQRLFRAAFEGLLGHDFPVEKLYELFRNLAPDGSKISVFRTQRWNTRPAYLNGLVMTLLHEVELYILQYSSATNIDQSVLSEVRRWRDATISLLDQEKLFWEVVDRMLSVSSSKNSLEWQESWDNAWSKRYHDLSMYLANWHEVMDGTLMDPTLQAMVQDVRDNIDEITLYSQYRIDIDEKQAIEESYGLVDLPPPLW